MDKFLNVMHTLLQGFFGLAGILVLFFGAMAAFYGIIFVPGDFVLWLTNGVFDWRVAIAYIPHLLGLMYLIGNAIKSTPLNE